MPSIDRPDPVIPGHLLAEHRELFQQRSALCTMLPRAAIARAEHAVGQQGSNEDLGLDDGRKGRVQPNTTVRRPWRKTRSSATSRTARASTSFSTSRPACAIRCGVSAWLTGITS